jgi:hypothetical protein
MDLGMKKASESYNTNRQRYKCKHLSIKEVIAPITSYVSKYWGHD